MLDYNTFCEASDALIGDRSAATALRRLVAGMADPSPSAGPGTDARAAASEDAFAKRYTAWIAADLESPTVIEGHDALIAHLASLEPDQRYAVGEEAARWVHRIATAFDEPKRAWLELHLLTEFPQQLRATGSIPNAISQITDIAGVPHEASAEAASYLVCRVLATNAWEQGKEHDSGGFRAAYQARFGDNPFSPSSTAAQLATQRRELASSTTAAPTVSPDVAVPDGLRPAPTHHR
ncbi:hypothetical protein AB0I28_32990 [Phytomonospora sp. NPDC050363]|uniref:hypothetical protein n=1 Tax=Phytomonospora sp. NPDC050363 TaxID=3155642 RepID=UPI0033F4E210